MKSYSPIDNIRRAAYPNILLTGGAPRREDPEHSAGFKAPQHLACYDDAVSGLWIDS